MPDLPEVTQTFEANAKPYLDAVAQMIEATRAFVDEIVKAEEALVELGSIAQLVATGISKSMDEAATATAATGAAAQAAAGRYNDLRNAAAAAALAEKAAGGAADGTAGKVAAAGAAAGVAAGFWGRWGRVIHWLVMGTLEIAATAIPALIAFAAAAAGMYPTFVHIYDQMNNLVTASGSVRNALLNSVGPLHNLGVQFGAVSRAMAPDAYVIFGSVINSLSGHFGAFSQVAQQAGNVLAAFATKLSAELSGPLGAQLAGFFSNAVKYMVQWGQFLGNLGHAFFNAVNAMWGVGQVLLDVLVKISQAFLAITNNPVGAWLIGIAAAMSAVYRYGQLMVSIWKWLGGSAAVTGIRNMYLALVEMVAVWPILVEEIGAADAALAIFESLMGPVAWAIVGITAVLGAWYLATRNTADATDNLIKKVESAPPSLHNLTSGIGLLEANLNALAATAGKQGAAFNDALAHMGRFGTSLNAVSVAAGRTNSDVNNTINAIRHEAQELINLDLGMAQAGMRTGQVGAAMNAMSIQTAIADSKVQAMNQAIDAYVGLLTGGTTAMAGFVQSMSNLTTGTNRITTILGQSGSATLSVKQFAQALTQMNAQGSAAWQNFNNVLTGSMGPLLDWFRQAAVVGAASGQDVTRAALDMAKSLVPLAVNSKAAQSELLGFLRAQGLNIKDFPTLEAMVRRGGVGMQDLTKRVDGTTTALSNLSQMAKNAATALNTQVSQAIAQAALASSGFNRDLARLQTDMANSAPANIIHADIGRVNSDLATAQRRAIETGNGIQSGMNTATRAMDAAKAHARMLQMMFDAMHGFNITNTVDTVYNQSGSPVGSSGPGGMGTPKHGAWGGYVSGPGTSTSDSVPAMLSHGEYVMNAAAVGHYGRSVMDAMNARHLAGGGPAITPGRPSPALAAAAGGGGGSGQMTVHLHNDIYLDKSKIASALRTTYLEFNRRNPDNYLNLRTR